MISFIFPIYKQEHVLEKGIIFLEQYLSKKLKEKYEIIICNDGSPDNCPQIADDLAKQFETVRSIGYTKNKGRGHAVKYSGLYAKGNYFIYMDCDLLEEQYIKYIDEMIQQVKHADLVVASRFLPASQSMRRWQRKIISKIYRILITFIFPGFKITDPDVGFKGGTKECFQHVNLMCNLNGPSWDLQFLINAHLGEYKITEFPFQYNEDYEKTTVNIFILSFVEFIGMIYIKITSIISKYIIF